MTMLEKVKISLRISHTKLDNDILDTIASARTELVRVGVDPSVANADDNELVNMCIKTYCLMIYAVDMTQREGYQKSFELQLDNLRKSVDYYVQ